MADLLSSISPSGRITLAILAGSIVLFGASQSFLSPVGYQTNLMVFGPGRYRFLDVARYGVPLTITMTLVVPWLICRQFGL